MSEEDTPRGTTRVAESESRDSSESERRRSERERRTGFAGAPRADPEETTVDRREGSSTDGTAESAAGTGLFDPFLREKQIFSQKEVLRPSYTPARLPHRSAQISSIATILVSALRGETPSNILIYGKTGTGKTASARYVSQELQRSPTNDGVSCEVQYINCEVTDTRYRVLARLANEFIDDNRRRLGVRITELEALLDRARADPSTLAETEFDSAAEIDDRIDELDRERRDLETVPMTGWPTDRVYHEFFEAVDRFRRVVVIVLDEIDKLVEKSGDDTLYNLSRMNSDLENSCVSIIGISNDLTFTDFLDPRVRSSLGEEEIVFPPYDADQLQDILEQRAEVAFKRDALDEGVIPLCAAFAAQEHGDARRALDLLRTAGELTERSKDATVSQAHVRRAQKKIEFDRIDETVRTLPTQSKLVLLAIIRLVRREERKVSTGEVFNAYERLCTSVGQTVLTQRRVTDLIGELDMLGVVNAAVVSKGRYGRTKEIGLSVPREKTEAILTATAALEDA
ncbi:Cdc6/Cdc18 family protein [Halegenticoccus soli]|uniref:Cdc6/Cdc18 family protein n=1 Tax=Halegenticoccus soli TaxID=1985678 RepID=UPI000C6DB3BC|nr:orc1/cdc6 family replication initiation protein [Halegenticoccus soli]